MTEILQKWDWQSCSIFNIQCQLQCSCIFSVLVLGTQIRSYGGWNSHDLNRTEYPDDNRHRNETAMQYILFSSWIHCLYGRHVSNQVYSMHWILCKFILMTFWLFYFLYKEGQFVYIQAYTIGIFRKKNNINISFTVKDSLDWWVWFLFCINRFNFVFYSSGHEIYFNSTSVDGLELNGSLSSLDQLQFSVHVYDLLNNTENIGLNFEYRPNPVIENITSRITIVR